jgi:hypothetical protein
MVLFKSYPKSLRKHAVAALSEHFQDDVERSCSIWELS